MKIITFFRLALFLAALFAVGRASFGATTGELLQQGLYAEEVEGNMDAAIQTYAKIIKTPSSQPNHVAQALYRQGMCYLKIKDEASARTDFERLVTEYASQTELVEKARPILDELTDFDPAALMPPGTLVYAEFGSPGKQIETILTMLKGTPFENPLAAISGGKTSRTNEKSPGDIIGALLNPGTIAEFKKIRSGAVGVTGMSKQHPNMIAALYPGKSDALRGLILAGLGVAGTPGESVEGLQRVNLPEDMAVAYDDKVIIMARPASQLEWSVRQYKRPGSEPTLASSNQSFAKLDKSQRSKNVATIWVNVQEAYGLFSKMFPKELMLANVFVDFPNISELMVVQSVESDALGARLELQFKDGHRCLAYDLIRTPNITKAALAAVPDRAVALASFSLNPTAAFQNEQVRSQIQNLIGLDVGREIFANIEQLTVFAMPAEENSANDFLPDHFGVAITSHDPEKTRQVLTTLLELANPVSTGQKNSHPGQFRIGKNGQRALDCYLDQVNGVTLLSLNRGVVDDAVAAIKNGKSAGNSGPLSSAINKLNPSASKVVLWNEGGMMRLIGPLMIPKGLTADQMMQVNTNAVQLERALDGTIIELKTDESPNAFALVASVRGLPALNNVIGPITRISQITSQSRTKTASKKPRQDKPALIMPATKAPAIDGQEDEVWSKAPHYKLANVIESFSSGEKPRPISSPQDLSAEFRAMWDEKNLYLLIDVTDDKLVSDTEPDSPVTLPSGSENIPWWYDDSIEVYLDADNAKAPEYGKHDAMFRFNWGPKPVMRVYNQNIETHLDGIEYAMVKTENGYRLEASFPWKTFEAKPAVGAMVGLDVHVNDDDDGGARDHKITWHDTTDQAYRSPEVFGNGMLGSSANSWKSDENESTIKAQPAHQSEAQ